MKNKRHNTHWVWILLGAILLLAAVVLYMIFPLHHADINERAVAGQAASYYNAVIGQESDSINAAEAQRTVEGE